MFFVCIRVYKLQNYKKHANLHSCRSVFCLFHKKNGVSPRAGARMTFFRGHKSAFVADFVNFAKNNALKSVELLAPAKDFQSAVAAVDYGADAVYIGGAKFGARYAAGNSAGEIARVVGICPSLRSAGACHAQHADLRRRAGGRRAAGPRTDRGRGRCADRAGHGACGA